MPVAHALMHGAQINDYGPELATDLTGTFGRSTFVDIQVASDLLMGRHVGTYWWGWQIRGNAEKGMVVSDYSLENANK